MSKLKNNTLSNILSVMSNILFVICISSCHINYSIRQTENFGKTARREMNQHVQRGRDYFAEGNFEQAIKEFQEALKIAPEKKEALEPLIKLCEETRQKELVEEQVRRETSKQSMEKERKKEVTRKTEGEKAKARVEEEKREREAESRGQKAEEIRKQRELKRIKGMGKVNIAVCDFEPRAPVSASEAAFITDFFRDDLVKTNVFNVVERNKMRMILEEQKFQQTGCTTSECAIELGHILSVQEVIIGSCGKLLDKFVIVMRVVEVGTGKIIYSDKGNCPPDAQSVEEIVNEMVEKLVRKLK